MEFTSTLRYCLADTGLESAAVVERLAEAGCDDALAGTGQNGRLALEFTREGSNVELVIASALSDVKRALPSIQLIEVLAGSMR